MGNFSQFLTGYLPATQKWWGIIFLHYYIIIAISINFCDITEEIT